MLREMKAAGRGRPDTEVSLALLTTRRHRSPEEGQLDAKPGSPIVLDLPACRIKETDVCWFVCILLQQLRQRYYFSRKLVLSGQTYFREKEGMNWRERRWKKMLVEHSR